VWVRDRGLTCCVGVGPTCAGATGGRKAACRFLKHWEPMKAKEAYLHLSDVCERAAAATHSPEAKVGLLASAAVWRRLAANFRPWTDPQQEKLAEQMRSLEELDARSCVGNS
jgi:hypothetical protein